jgi:hypothetical protein
LSLWRRKAAGTEFSEREVKQRIMNAKKGRKNTERENWDARTGMKQVGLGLGF